MLGKSQRFFVAADLRRWAASNYWWGQSLEAYLSAFRIKLAERIFKEVLRDLW
jgi:hypothetical protein